MKNGYSIVTDGSNTTCVEKAKANEKRASKKEINVVDDKEIMARNNERIPKNSKVATVWCLNAWDEWATERNALISELF